MRRRSASVPLLVLVLSVVGLLVVDQVVAEPEVAAPLGRIGDTVPRSGLWVCAAGDGRDGGELTVEAARPDAVGDEPATIELHRQHRGQVSRVSVPRLFPGAAARLPIEAGEDRATVARWFDAPAVVSRTWRSDGEGERPPGTAAGPCAPSTAASSWILPGMTTAGGGEVLLQLANPHPIAATVAVRFLTPDGVESPTVLRNVSVPARGSVAIAVNDHVPEQPDLAAVVEVLSGRVAAEGIQFTHAAIGGVDGVSLVAAAATAAETWTVPWVVDGDERTSWLWVANLDDRSAPVELTLHTADGGVVPDGLAEVSVPPGTVRRVDLRGTFPEDVDSAAVTVRSNGVPVVVSGVAQLTAEDPAETGFAVQLGAPAMDRTWVVSGGASEGRAERLRLVNPGSEPATVDLSLWNGATVSRPAELAGLEIAAGAIVSVDLRPHLDDTDAWAVTVQATDGQLIVGRVGIGDPEGPAHVVAGAGAPSAAWRAPEDGLFAVLQRGLAQRLGTAAGIRPRARFPAEVDDEDEEPPPGAPSPDEEPADDEAPPPADGGGEPPAVAPEDTGSG